jgi:hypothetical protein
MGSADGALREQPCVFVNEWSANRKLSGWPGKEQTFPVLFSSVIARGYHTRIAVRSTSPTLISSLRRSLRQEIFAFECPSLRIPSRIGPEKSHYRNVAFCPRTAFRATLWSRGVARWFRWGLSVTDPFVSRCLTSSALLPSSHPAHRTGRADLPHPALGEDLHNRRSHCM